MKILRITYEYPPPWAGLTPQPYEISRFQAQDLGHEISILSGRWPKQGKQVEVPNVKNIYFLGNPNLPFREFISGTLVFTISPIVFLRYLIWRRKNAVDLIHCHGHFAIWIYGYRKLLLKYRPLSKELQTPVVAHFHNTVAGRWEKLRKKNSNIKWFTKKFQWPVEMLSDKWAVEVSDACIFVSEELKQDAIKYYNANETKCFVIESGVNTKLFKPVNFEERDKTRKEFGIDDFDVLVAGIHSYISLRKNPESLVLALKYLPEKYKVLLSGPYAGERNGLALKEHMDKVLEENKLKSRVLMSGFVPYETGHIIFQASDIFVLPSDFEGSSKSVIEALSSGIPALVSGFKLQEDIEGLFYLEDNKNPEKIAEQILKITSQKPKVDRDLVHDKYSWSVKVRKIEEIYRHVLSTKSTIKNK